MFSPLPRSVSQSSSPAPLAFSCRSFSACCLFALRGDVGACSVVCTLTHLQLQQRNSSRQLGVLEQTPAPLSLKCLCGESAGCLLDLSASRARWRWADCVAACCYNAHFMSSFSLWFFCFCCEDGKSLALRLKRHMQKKETRERESDSVWMCWCEGASSEYNVNFWEKEVVFCKDKGLHANMLASCERSKCDKCVFYARLKWCKLKNKKN